MVLSRFKEPINRVAMSIAAVLEWLGLTPNSVTVLGLVISGIGAGLIAMHHLIIGAAVAGFGSILDLFDGALARRTGQVTPFGGYLDSLLDRYGDGIAFLAVAWHYQTTWIWVVAFLGFLGAAATSYAKARTYEDASPPSNVWPDLVERGERLVILYFAVGFQGIANALDAGVEFLPWIVVALAVLGHVTVIQRASRAKGFVEGKR